MVQGSIPGGGVHTFLCTDQLVEAHCPTLPTPYQTQTGTLPTSRASQRPSPHGALASPPQLGLSVVVHEHHRRREERPHLVRVGVRVRARVRARARVRVRVRVS